MTVPLDPQLLQDLVLAVAAFLLTQLAKTRFNTDFARALVAATVAFVGAIALGLVKGELPPIEQWQTLLAYLGAHFAYIYTATTALFHLIYKPARPALSRVARRAGLNRPPKG